MSKESINTELFDFSKSISPLVELLKTNYGDVEITNEKYLNWEYLNNPAGKPITSVVIDPKGKVAGQYLVIPISLKVGNGIHMGSLSLNTLTREDYRGKGLFTKMAFDTYAACSEGDVVMTYGFPNESSYPGFVRKLGFTHTGNAPIFFKPLSILKIVYKKVIKKSKIKYGLELLPKTQNLTPFGNGKFKVSSIDFNKDETAYNVFKDEFSLNYKVMVDRSFKFLKWKYSDMPTRSYKILKVEFGDKICGYCVLRARQVYGLNSGFIVDFCSLQDETSEEASRFMLKCITKYFKANNIDLIGTMIYQHTFEYKLLSKAGFFSVPKKLLPHNNPVISRVNKLFPDSDLVLDEKNWFLTFGDYDVM